MTELDPKLIPKCVGVIMDGNGRWAKARDLPRTKGHSAGEDALVRCVDGALELGIKWLAVYAFSTENWRRPAEEVKFLMTFNRELLARRTDEFVEKGVRVRFMGRKDDRRLPRSVVKAAEQTEAATIDCKRLNLCVGLNYGGRAEILDAVNSAIASGADRIDEKTVGRNLYVPQMPEVDLVIRTSGEVRTSNFLAWQAAYAEWVFTPVLWPDFTGEDLRDAVRIYQERSRRFGGID